MTVRVALLSLAALCAAACSPRRVDIVERPPGGYTAVARAEPGEKCDAELRQRANDEASYHCDARGRRAVIETRSEKITPQGCVLSVAFSCASR